MCADLNKSDSKESTHAYMYTHIDTINHNDKTHKRNRRRRGSRPTQKR